jgi:subtilisin family serine protease
LDANCFARALGASTQRTPVRPNRSRLLLVFVLAAAVGLVQVAPSSGSDAAGVANQLGGPVAEKSPKEALTPAEQKVDSFLRRAAAPTATPSGRSAQPLAQPPAALPQDADRVQVIVDVTGTAPEDIKALEAAGLQVEIVNDRFHLVQGWIDPGALSSLAALDIVRSVSPALPAEHNVGSVTSQGDSASRANLVRQLGYDGRGVVVGVISNGIDSLAASQATGDLPSVVVPFDPRCHLGTGDEGTAMLEIVHDLAPSAELRFSGPGPYLEMIDSINCLAASGAKIIVDDLFYPDQPFFEDGPVAMTAAEAVAAGVSYHTSAANYADRNYLAEDYRPGGNGYHDFDPGPGQDFYNLVTVPPGGVLRCYLQWADPWAGSGNDYDLEAYLPASGTRVGVGGDSIQNGSQHPYEQIVVANPFSYPWEVGLAIRNYSGASRALKLLCPHIPLNYATTQQYGISGHAARPEVVTVAAISVRDPGLDNVEAFSSRGPAATFLSSPVLRQKPDLAAFDGVVTTLPLGEGLNPFFGTSAAAPHSAAVAALLLSKNPTLTPAQVRAVLTSTAVDIGAPGFDNAAGFGRIDAVAAINAVTAPTTLPTCNPSDCDGDMCTIDDACDNGVCHAGTRVTPQFVCDRASATVAPCVYIGDNAEVWPKIATPLAKTSRLLAQANTASGRKRSKKLSQARAAVRLANRRLSQKRPHLSPGCAAAFDQAMSAANTALACVP